MNNCFEPEDIKQNKVYACLGYLGVLFLIPLLFKPKSDFAMFHGKQGMVLFIAEVVGAFVNVVPFFGSLFWLALVVLFVVLSIRGVLVAWRGEMWEMPYLGKCARKIKIDV